MMGRQRLMALETERLYELWRGLGGKSVAEMTPDERVEVLDAMAAER